MTDRHLSLTDRIYEFTSEMDAIATVEAGSSVTFETINSVEDAVHSEDDVVSSVPDEVNGATGPLAIDGAEPGDVLAVTIEDITITEDIGRVLVMDGFGLQQDEDWVDAPRTRITNVDKEEATFGDISIPLEPVIGTIGVAPATGEYSTLTPHDHGGNLDTTDITTGTTVYFPVFQKGGLLAMGDSKAVMADGEMCGTGAEIGTEIETTVNLISNPSVELARPLLETADAWKTLASAETLEEACELANSDLVELLSHAHGFDQTDAYMFSSLVGGLEISQVVDPLVTVRNAVPKRYLPHPFAKD